MASYYDGHPQNPQQPAGRAIVTVTVTVTAIGIGIAIMTATATTIAITKAITAEAAHVPVGMDAAVLTLVVVADLVIMPKGRSPQQSHPDWLLQPRRPCAPERSPVAGLERRGNGSLLQPLVPVAQTGSRTGTNAVNAIYWKLPWQDWLPAAW